ncbi:hypothetical protein E4U58_004709, partial [Claviceps cyperi]
DFHAGAFSVFPVVAEQTQIGGKLLPRGVYRGGMCAAGCRKNEDEVDQVVTKEDVR